MTRNIEQVEMLVKNLGYKLIETYFYKVNKQTIRRVLIQDTDGYKYSVQLSSLLERYGNVRFVGKSNPYSLENISLWLKLNNKPFYLCDNQKYEANSKKLLFYCFNCEDKFTCSWISIFSGQGCGICAGQQIGKYNNLKYLYPELAKEWHPNNKLKPSEVTIGSDERVMWICSNCSYEWETVIYSRGKYKTGCPSCSGALISDENRLSTLYPEISSEWHPSKNGNLTPNDVFYRSGKKAWWLCPNKHEYFSTISSRTNGSNCPKCNISKGEMKVSKLLDNNNIQYISQHKFDDCIDKRKLPFDFYLPYYNLCIEYHGKQHYESSKFFGGKKELIKCQKRDKIKEDYCKNNNIKLLIIPHWDFKNIEKILAKTLL